MSGASAARFRGTSAWVTSAGVLPCLNNLTNGVTGTSAELSRPSETPLLEPVDEPGGNRDFDLATAPGTLPTIVCGVATGAEMGAEVHKSGDAYGAFGNGVVNADVFFGRTGRADAFAACFGDANGTPIRECPLFGGICGGNCDENNNGSTCADGPFAKHVS